MTPDTSPAPLQVEPIPAFDDNYIWLLHRGGRDCAVVDPGDHEPVLQALEQRGMTLRTILVTHHHWDHIGGVKALLQRYPATVFGPQDERLGDWNQPCREGETVHLPELGLHFEVLEVPAHTRTHIAYQGHGILFSGDTLFSIGCGRLFEGTPEDMQAAMDKFRRLPGATVVYCTHEYTQDNCRFALAVEPDNSALQARAAEVSRLRAANRITLPVRLEDELAANPFLRTREPAVIHAARQRDPAAEPGASTMAVIRAWKDSF